MTRVCIRKPSRPLATLGVFCLRQNLKRASRVFARLGLLGKLPLRGFQPLCDCLRQYRIPRNSPNVHSSGGIVLMHRPPEKTEFKRSANERCQATTPKGRDGLRMQPRVNDARERLLRRVFYNQKKAELPFRFFRKYKAEAHCECNRRRCTSYKRLVGEANASSRFLAYLRVLERMSLTSASVSNI